MAKSYFVINNGRLVHGVSSGFYDEETACKFAHDEAEYNPGKTFKVMMEVCTYKFDRKPK